VLLFFIALLPLLMGPLLVRLLSSRPRLTPALDGFVFVSVGGIVLLHILPDAIDRASAVALVAAVAGFGLPYLLERGHHHDEPSAAPSVMLFALVGLALHGSLDGVALAAGSLHADNGLALSLGVIVHRLPEGVAVWWFASRAVGDRRALLVLAVPVLFSALGFGGSLLLPRIFESAVWDVLQALLFGSLAHVLLHEPPGGLKAAGGHRWQVASFCGALLGGLLLFGLELFEAHHHSEPSAERLSAMNAFVLLCLDSAAPILLGFAAAGMLHVFSFDRVFRWMGRGGALAEALKGAVVGIPLNVCSCSVLPVYRSLASANVSKRGTLSFMIAAPEVGIATLAISLALLGWEMSLIRVLSAVLLGVLVSLVTNGLLSRLPPKPEALVSRPPPPAAASGTSRLLAGLSVGFGELLDHTLPWLLLGLGLAAILEPLVSPAWIVALPIELQIPLAAVIGVPLYVCASGSTPLVVLLMHKGLCPGAALAFLLSGPATNIATFGLLSRLYGRRYATVSAVGVVLFAASLGYLYELSPGHMRDVLLHERAHESHGFFAWLGLAGLGALTMASLLRQGVRGFVGQVMRFSHHHDNKKEFL